MSKFSHNLEKLTAVYKTPEVFEIYTEFEHLYYGKHKDEYLASAYNGSIAEYDARKEDVFTRYVKRKIHIDSNK